MQVQSTLSRVSTTVDTLLTILECISDEKFWQRAFGQRILELGKRYFGNGFVLLSMGFYVACKLVYIYIYLSKVCSTNDGTFNQAILRTQWQKLLAYLWQRRQQQEVKSTVEVQVNICDNAYQAIDHFVRKNAKKNPRPETIDCFIR